MHFQRSKLLHTTKHEFRNTFRPQASWMMEAVKLMDVMSNEWLKPVKICIVKEDLRLLKMRAGLRGISLV